MSLDGINWLAVLLATASAFLLGGIWYGPLFKRAWCRENGTDPDAPPKGHPGKVFGIAILAAFVAAAPAIGEPSGLDGKEAPAGATAMNAEQRQVMEMFGNTPEDIAKYGV